MKAVNVGVIKLSHFIGSFEHNMALPELGRLTGAFFCLDTPVEFIVVVYVVHFQYFFKNITI